MKDAVQQYVQAVGQLFQYFQCPEEYLIRSLADMRWRIWEEEEVFFLTYWNGETPGTSLVMARKNGCPVIYEGKDYTMAVAIDCVKIGFILSNEKREGE